MKARMVRVKPGKDGLAQLAEAAKLLDEGALVAFPTETVYGIGCNAGDAAAVERLTRVKRRAPDKPFSIHIGRIEDVGRHVGRIPEIGRALMRRYWPGPLTIVFPGRGGKGVGVRMPSSRIAAELLRRTTAAVIAPSANRCGEPPAKSADEVAATLGDELDLILDGGPTALQEASAVVRVGDEEDWTILRQGSVTEEMIRRTLGHTIVFVCTASTCRSPIAETLCKQMLAERLGCTIDELPARGYSVLSAGTAAAWDMPASTGASDVMRQLGLDLSAHRAKPLTPGLIEDADEIYVMTRQHAASITGLFPEATAKVRLLDPAGGDIADPVGASAETFLACARSIQRHLREVIDLP